MKILLGDIGLAIKSKKASSESFLKTTKKRRNCHNQVCIILLNKLMANIFMLSGTEI